jgi:RNA-directed DNA polymerase
MLENRIAEALGLPVGTIQVLARKANHSYKTYHIPKRNGGHRVIHHPAKQLKAVQRWLLDNVIDKWPVHSAATAYRLGISIKANAEIHASSKYLLRMDFMNFYPSISDKDILSFLDSERPSNTADWELKDKNLFVNIVCRNSSLTIGAPTSPGISNAICIELDRRLAGVAQTNELIYTRYADDLSFSSRIAGPLANIPGEVAKVLQDLRFPSALTVNHEKTRHSSKRSRRRVTGLVLASDGIVSLGRKRKRWIRSLVFKYESLNAEEKSSLAGLLSFSKSIDPDFINSLVTKYGYDRVSDAQRHPTTG